MYYTSNGLTFDVYNIFRIYCTFHENRLGIDRVINEKLTFILDHPPPLDRVYFMFLWLTSCSGSIESLHIQDTFQRRIVLELLKESSLDIDHAKS